MKSSSAADFGHTTCCVVGAGPAGMVLALLLARQNVAVTLLEAHLDLDRDFRGDTIHPPTLELLDRLELAKRLLALPHTKLRRLSFSTPAGQATAVDFSRLKSNFPYLTIMPQAAFLQFLADEAAKNAAFKFVRGANVQLAE
ncbi:MAG: FAD-dependent monooxygenase [Planctomycetaceae bacterium]